MAEILINGRRVHVPDSHTTDKEIRKMANMDSE